MRYFEDPILGKGRAADVSGGTCSADYVGGTRIAIEGETISFVNSATIQNVTGNSVTLEPDTAYKITATASAVTLNANVPAAGSWAYEGHAEIFVAGTGYIVTGANVVLANPLEPDAVNNCVLRFHDGTCIIDVEDHVYGYIVTSISGTTQGTLPYGITSATSNYIAFDATTNGSTINLSGSTASAEKHLVGNGYTSTTLTGAVDCGANKFTVANLSLQNVQVGGGVMTLGDAFIPSGSTVSVPTGGAVAIEKAELDGTIVVSGGKATPSDGSKIVGSGTLSFFDKQFFNKAVDCEIVGATLTNNFSTQPTNAALAQGGYGLTLSNCTISSCRAYLGLLTFNYSASKNAPIIKDCTFTDNYTYGLIYVTSGATVHLAGYNKFEGTTRSDSVLPEFSGSGSVLISSGAIIDLTGNTHATFMQMDSGITFASGGATVLYSSGAVSGSYMMDNVTLPAGAKLTNTAVVDLGGKHAVVSSNTTASASGVTVTGGTANAGGAFYTENGTMNFSNCIFSGCSATTGIVTGYYENAVVNLTGCTFTDNTGYVPGPCVTNSAVMNLSNCTVTGDTFRTMYCTTGAKMNFAECTLNATCVLFGGSATFAGENTVKRVAKETDGSGFVTISSGATINLTSSIDPGGTGGITVLTGGCTVNGNVIAAGTYTSIDSNGQPT